MSFAQRSVWFQLTAELILIFWFVRRFGQRYGAGAFDGPEGLMALGRSMLWFALAMVVLVIAVHILGLIALAIAEGGTEPDTMTDERDKAIEFAGQRVAHGVSGAGFLAGMALLAFGFAAPVAVAACFVGGLTGEVIGNIVKLAGYLRG